MTETTKLSDEQALDFLLTPPAAILEMTPALSYPDLRAGQKPIGSKGSRTAKIVVVGEAPGAQEALAGLPFVGASGKELDKMLIDAGIFKVDAEGKILNYDSVFFTNVTLIRPKDNDIEEWLHRGKRKAKGKKPTPQHWVEYRGWHCEPHVVEDAKRLIEEIRAINPNVVICLGNTPFWAFCAEGIKGKVGTWRGSTLISDIIPGLKVIPAYHPAFILRQWQHRRITVQDLRRASWAAASPVLEPPGWDFTVRPTYEQATGFLLELLARLEQGPVKMTCDIEGAQKKTLCVGIGVSARRALCIPILYEFGWYWPKEQEVIIVILMAKVLRHKNARVINQNIPFDVQFTVADYLIYPNIWWDTMVGQNILWPGTPMNLAYQASMYCSQYRYWKDDSEEFWKAKKISNWDDIWFYNCEDCARTFEVQERQEEAIARRGLVNQFNFMMYRVFPLIMKIMFKGVRVNHPRRIKMLEELYKVVNYAQVRVNYLATRELNIDSPKQLSDLFYREMKLPVQLSAEGTPTCDAYALVTLGQIEPLVKELCKWINLVRSYGTAIAVCNAKPDPDERWRSAYSLGIVETYRLSSKINAFGRGLNLMNITSGKDVKGSDDDD